ncbi:hypothetical protein MKW98_004176 [Papaver atlanticum]|uniref:RING-type domain-containing protein n=1 Tax=Papaver atlanticum TaxID=357466 RepID=A0AAD4SG22_9MAGN|nr:hypothetical protein MKW98_004176 [Papaver atlanticum]
MGTLQKIGTIFEDEEKEKLVFKQKKIRGIWLPHFGSVEQEVEKQSDPESFLFVCEICAESDLPLNKKFNNKEKKAADCSSKHPLCTDCISKYIKAKVVDNNSSDIVCPDFDCKVNLDILSCQSIVPPKVFVRWCALLCESKILSKYAQNLAYCPHCFECVLNECGDSTGITKSKCPNCKKLFCFSCMIPLIEGESHTCSRQRNGDAIIMTEKNDLLLMQTAKQNAWTRCPTCKHYVERISGCHVITCRWFLFYFSTCVQCARRNRMKLLCMANLIGCCFRFDLQMQDPVLL